MLHLLVSRRHHLCLLWRCRLGHGQRNGEGGSLMIIVIMLNVLIACWRDFFSANWAVSRLWLRERHHFQGGLLTTMMFELFECFIDDNDVWRHDGEWTQSRPCLHFLCFTFVVYDGLASVLLCVRCFLWYGIARDHWNGREIARDHWNGQEMHGFGSVWPKFTTSGARFVHVLRCLSDLAVLCYV